jgi:hypothetical protein
MRPLCCEAELVGVCVTARAAPAKASNEALTHSFFVTLALIEGRERRRTDRWPRFQRTDRRYLAV